MLFEEGEDPGSAGERSPRLLPKIFGRFNLKLWRGWISYYMNSSGLIVRSLEGIRVNCSRNDSTLLQLPILILVEY